MSVDQLLDWQAQVASFLARDDTLTPIVTRMQFIIDSNRSTAEKTSSARKLLDGVIENSSVPFQTTPLAYATGLNPTTAPVQVNVWGSSVSQSQYQEITQPINPRWSEIEEQIDSYENLSSEQKDEAKGYARTILDGAANGVKNGSAVITALQSLSQNAPDILKFLGVG